MSLTMAHSVWYSNHTKRRINCSLFCLDLGGNGRCEGERLEQPEDAIRGAQIDAEFSVGEGQQFRREPVREV